MNKKIKLKVGDLVRIKDGSKHRHNIWAWMPEMSLYVGEIHYITKTKTVKRDSKYWTGYIVDEIEYVFEVEDLELIENNVDIDISITEDILEGN